MKRWWQKERPDQPAVEFPLRDHKGEIIGRIVVNPDGTFVGKIESGSFYGALKQLASLGFTDGIVIQAKVEPPKPPEGKNS